MYKSSCRLASKYNVFVQLCRSANSLIKCKEDFESSFESRSLSVLLLTDIPRVSHASSRDGENKGADLEHEKLTFLCVWQQDL